MKKYYFISYVVKSRESDRDFYGNDVIDVHPISWQIDCNDKYGKDGEEYLVLWWKELTKEEFELGDGYIG